MSGDRAATASSSRNVLSFSVLNAPIAIRSAEPRVLAAFRRLYCRLPEASPQAAGHQVEILAHEEDSETPWQTIAADLPERRQATLGGALRQAEASCCIHAIRAARELITIHAATVVFESGLALITGDSGAGKTTLTLALAARGRPVDGDDVTVVDPETGLVCGLPRCFHLDERSIGLLLDEGLDVRAREVCEGFLTPSDVGDAGVRARPVRALFLLRPGDGARPEVSRRPLSEAVALLDGQTGPRYRPSTELFQHFSRLLGDASFFEIRRGELGSTADRIVEVMGDIGS